jgi:hypothetical protein
MWAHLHSLLGPHFTTQLRVQPSRAVKGLTRRSSDRKRAPAAPREEERHDCRGTDAVWAWGSPPWVERAPRKFGWWGAKQVEAKNTPLTISALSFPQFTHILSRIFFTLTMNPVDEYWDDREAGSDMPRTWMENRSSQFNVPEMSWALRHRLPASLTFEVSINRTHTGIH